MYSQSTQAARRRRPAAQGRRTGKQEESGRRERVRLVQLLACLALFLTVFIGKGVFPQRLDQLGEDILALIGSNTDFRAAFSDLGESLAEQDSVLGDIGEFCIQVFGSGQDSGGEASPALAGGVEEESRFLNSRPDMAELTAHYLRLDRVPDSWLPGEQAEGEAAQQTPQAQTAAPAVGTVLLKANYNGPELPANYTMDQISLGDLETVTPVFGPLWSTYGYRDHPIDGEYRFHNGVDIGAYQGDPILAFAAGTVEYVGENDDHGLYFQIDHGNGIKSFYAHCSRICVTTGQTVSAGEKVAEVGSTGNSTGPQPGAEIRGDPSGPGILYRLQAGRLSGAGEDHGHARIPVPDGLVQLCGPAGAPAPGPGRVRAPRAWPPGGHLGAGRIGAAPAADGCGGGDPDGAAHVLSGGAGSGAGGPGGQPGGGLAVLPGRGRGPLRRAESGAGLLQSASSGQAGRGTGAALSAVHVHRAGCGGGGGGPGPGPHRLFAGAGRAPDRLGRQFYPPPGGALAAGKRKRGEKGKK